MKDPAGEIIELQRRLTTLERHEQLIIGGIDALQAKFDQVLVALTEMNSLLQANAGMTAELCEAIFEEETSEGESVN
jgi:hypothetical protein